MKVAVVGSRTINTIPLETFLPPETNELVSGGAKGVDTYVRFFAQQKGVKLTEFFPDYSRYGRAAPLLRNRQIVDYADAVLAFWDGSSRGTKYVISQCQKKHIPICVYMPEDTSSETIKEHFNM